MKKKILTTLFIVSAIAVLQAQTSANSCGDVFSGSGGTVCFSVGQVVFSTHSGNNGSVSEEVHQPYEISVITELEEAKKISLSIMVYPNPTHEFLKLKLEHEKFPEVNFQLFDIQGNILQHETIYSTETQIDMRNYISATYYVKIINQNQAIKVFKIIKQ